MIEPAMYVFLRDGQATLYRDPCGSALFVRNLIWGPDELESWLAARQSVPHHDPEAAAGALVDYDKKQLLWWADDEGLELPKANVFLQRLLETAWPGYRVDVASGGLAELETLTGQSSRAEDQRMVPFDEQDDELDEDPLADRYETIEEDLEARAEIEGDEDWEDWLAWVSILTADQVIEHRTLTELTQDVIGGKPNVIERLLQLEPAAVPRELDVKEGLMIDEPSRRVLFWGGRNIRLIEESLQAGWIDWKVSLVTDQGYEKHCQFSGPMGEPATDAEALGSLVPMLLFTKRIDAGMLMGQLGKSLKGCAAQVVGFLTFLICLPLLIFAAVTGNWQGAGITIGIIVVLVVILFKVVEYRWMRSFSAILASGPGIRGRGIGARGWSARGRAAAQRNRSITAARGIAADQ